MTSYPLNQGIVLSQPGTPFVWFRDKSQTNEGVRIRHDDYASSAAGLSFDRNTGTDSSPSWLQKIYFDLTNTRISLGNGSFTDMDGPGILIQGEEAQIRFRDTTGGEDDYQLVNSDGTFKIVNYSDTRDDITILGDGNVGIGGTPSTKLTVVGGDILLDNDKYIQGKDTGGTARGLIAKDANDDTKVVTASTKNIVFFEGSGERMRLNAIGLGIGATPAGALHVSNNAATNVFFDRHSADASAPALLFRKSRGTAASPSVISTGDDALVIEGRAYDGSAYVTYGELLVDAQTVTGSAEDGRYRLRLVGGGTIRDAVDIDAKQAYHRWSLPSTGVEIMRLNATGLGVGVTPTASLHVSASTTARASILIPAGTAPSSPNSGDIWHDSTQKTVILRMAGMSHYGATAIQTSTADVVVGNTTTETGIIGSGIGTLVLPANFFTVGKSIRLRTRGIYSTIGAPGTVDIRFKFGSTTLITAAAVTPPGSETDRQWEVEITLTCRTIGGTGTVMANGTFEFGKNTGDSARFGLVATSAATVDTTASQTVGLTWEWGTADAGNTATSQVSTLQTLA